MNTCCDMGVVVYSYMMVWKPVDTLEFLEHCHARGAAGVQMILRGDVQAISRRAEELGLYLEAIVPMPWNDDTEAFEDALRMAKEAGAVALRSACLDTRRYESYRSASEWKEHVAMSRRAIETALPLLEKYKLPLGLENHKDWTREELLAVMQRYGGEYFGVCFDLGNNLALMDDPFEMLGEIAPWVVTTHVKDMALEPCEDGFLLSEVPLGRGFLQVERALKLLRRARPGARFSLEMITRDPLRIPCLRDEYWATFPDRPATDLARTLRFVQTHASAVPLPRVGHLSYDEQRELEDRNVAACLEYARQIDMGANE